MIERKIMKSKNCVRFDLKLAEIGCIKTNLQEYSNVVGLYGNEISGLEDWQANILHRLTKEFEKAEQDLHDYKLSKP